MVRNKTKIKNNEISFSRKISRVCTFNRCSNYLYYLYNMQCCTKYNFVTIWYCLPSTVYDYRLLLFSINLVILNSNWNWQFPSRFPSKRSKSLIKAIMARYTNEEYTDIFELGARSGHTASNKRKFNSN